MRLLAFTLLAITVGTGIQYTLSHLPYSVDEAMYGFDTALMFVLPAAVTIGLAYAMRISNAMYVYFAVILSPFVAFISAILFSVFVLNERLYFP